ncbi:hypothetical protein MUK42_20539 [Musa troglodytarum]|uniref:Uncharacterized protein n=1 Tax=Musa troglodytarum TaxID=320322 RepID=A0A9E7FUQ1_9LILI|nr:hypothetical protein MUK42_20539 [Musa troglodytarum]
MGGRVCGRRVRGLAPPVLVPSKVRKVHREQPGWVEGRRVVPCHAAHGHVLPQGRRHHALAHRCDRVLHGGRDRRWWVLGFLYLP